jgi:hypothetical protein
MSEVGGDPMEKRHKINNRLTVLRTKEHVFLIDYWNNMEVELSLEESCKIGTYLRDITDDSLVNSGCVGMDPSAHSLDRREYEEEVRES